MRRLAILALAALPALVAASPWQPEARAGGFSSYRLNNGFRLILAPFPDAPTTRVELLVKTGSKHEGYGETGMAHLLEHMLFKGAGRHHDLKQALTALGATWNGTTNTDRTNYFATVRAEPEKVDELIRIEADRFLRPTFSAADLASEMTVVRNELERNDNNPGSLVARALQRQSFFWHGYGRPTIGARSDIENAPFAALQAFHHRHYRPDNAVLIVTGKFDAARVLDLVGQLFAPAQNPPGPPPATWTREEAERLRQRAEIYRESGSTVAAVAWLLPGASDRQTLAVDLALPALCADSWGSLRRTLVDEKRLALGAACVVQDRPEYSLLIANVSHDKDADAATLAAALREAVDHFARHGIDAAQLKRVRTSRLRQFDRARLSPETTASALSGAEVAGDWRLFFVERDIVATLTLDEINAALRHWIAGVAPAEVLLHHGPPPRTPEPPAAVPGRMLVEAHGKRDWPVPTLAIDPLPKSPAELGTATVAIPLADPSAKAALISRRTQDGRARLVIANDFGDSESLRGRQTACRVAGSLLAEGGAGIERSELGRKLATLQAQASQSLGRISLTAPPAKLGPALELLLAVRRQPTLPEAAFERIRAMEIASLEASQKHPGELASRQAMLRFNNYSPEHPNRPRTVAEQLAELRALSLDDVRRCIADFGGRSQLRIAAVGDLDEAAVQGFWQSLQSLPQATLPYARIAQPTAPMQVDTDAIVVALGPFPNADVVGLSQLPLRDDDEDYLPLALAVRLLGGDASSRLRVRVREQEGLAYSVNAALAANPFDARARLTITASVASDQAERAREILREELARALAEGFSEQEVAAGIARWQESRRRTLQAETTYADRLAAMLQTGRDVTWDVAHDARIAELTAAGVNAALRRHLGQAPIVWAIGKGQSDNTNENGS
ncbi:M16 family metallopeptidase [Azonexus hydrophilus]|uniref:M16 family metallopeptidase n=1 Tax=Azonexus hydrophilus TaxID=418702 RepID=UPI00040471FB|nr:M16 family metallopeptidase [Azonexus hydrophilus]